MTYRFHASCPKHLEDLLEREITASGGVDISPRPAGVGFTGTLETAYRLCLWSRLASRVFLELKEAPVASASDAYALAAQVPWNDHLSCTGSFAVTASVIGKHFPDSPDFTALKVKDALADTFRRTSGTRPSVDSRSPDLIIHIHVERGRGVLSLDLSGGGLHRRGYRISGGAAPLRENIAAAILCRARWDSFAAQGKPLIDPLCGSGTLLIEGAMMAADIAPGLLRKEEPLPAWKGFEPAVWNDLITEALERRREGESRMPPLFGFDVDRKAVSSSEANTRAAGLEGKITFKKCPVDRLTNPLPGKTGLLVTNPPYGIRMGSEEGTDLPEVLGRVFRSSFPGWSVSILSPDEGFQKSAGMKADRVNTMFNGPIECRLYHFEIFSGADRKAFTEKADEGLSPGGEMFHNRLRKNLKHLKAWKEREKITCYRLYDADMSEYALAADLYQDVFGKIRVHVQEYAPPPEIDKARSATRLKDACTVIRREFGLSREDLILKVRRRQRGDSQYTRIAETTERFKIEEQGLRFLVTLTDYLDTGIFLDHRQTRELIRRLSEGKRFLNLFSYTGTASVYAAAGGAVSTVSVDTSKTYLDWGADNLLTNGFRGAGHSIVRQDSMTFLETSSDTYDLIFIDPPTFSNSKSREGFFDIQRDHGRLLSLAARRLTPGGLILFSTNARRFKFREDEIHGLSAEEITAFTLPPDFQRGRSGHRAWLVSPRSLHGAMATKPKNLYDLADLLNRL
ncbi:MAG: bifunctional 23S rRNA (guanine(2069)-N(7))-methyltransferase RlmK/23S rRNA (guanine(2445)-N(2))-methyltransferase RlmL [Spirochaetales bacterium]|nr:bifunctional 23S rRNA (guanine(2069)-N(7))-methyltransferase RlmK/23S rRNA (guanine(2445)-N(2))-methyltransferase RlmL [Spirochaetales bacterium]